MASLQRCAVIGLACCASLGMVRPAWAVETASEQQINQLTQQAAQTQNPEQAVALLKQAADLAPEQPGVHLNYGIALFKSGQRQSQSDQKVEGMATFRNAEQELLAALRLAKNEPDVVGRKQLKSQAALLLGDVHFFVFKDKVRAKRYYEDALWYDPQNPGVLAARKRFGDD